MVVLFSNRELFLTFALSVFIGFWRNTEVIKSGGSLQSQISPFASAFPRGFCVAVCRATTSPLGETSYFEAPLPRESVADYYTACARRAAHGAAATGLFSIYGSKVIFAALDNV